MASVEEISQIAMSVITYAGLARSLYIDAFRLLKKGNETTYRLKMDEGDKNFTKAHEVHTEILQKEMNMKEPQITMLLAHAEDQLMSAETIKIILCELTNDTK